MAQMIMRASEGRSLGDMLFFLFLPRFPRIISSDIGCQGSSWARCRLRFYFQRWRWLVDLFHIGPHKCKLITNPREFSSMRELNDSIVEQLHSAQRALGMTMQSTSSERAMFLVQLINYDIYCKLANDAKFSRVWPEDASFTLTMMTSPRMYQQLQLQVFLLKKCPYQVMRRMRDLQATQNLKKTLMAMTQTVR